MIPMSSKKSERVRKIVPCTRLRVEKSDFCAELKITGAGILVSLFDQFLRKNVGPGSKGGQT